MKNFILFIALFSLQEATSQTYFQQKVDYTIDVQLYDQENMLRGSEEFVYHNNSPQDLTYIYVHLWPNGYKNNKTALGYQLYDMNNMVMENASAAELGYIDSLDFTVNGVKANWEYDPEHLDICKLILDEPLKSGQSMKVATPFKVKIPSGDISRMGYVGESFQITQWYPKPAVFDQNGWHQMPYLTQGEFYSEYGTFDVSITLPTNYVVGATGDLQTESEIEFLNEKAAKSQTKLDKADGDSNKGDSSIFPASDSTLKTIRYTQKDIHDFAWFADKRFEVLKGVVELPNSGRKVTSWAMFVPHHAELWSNAIEYLNDATFYYSKWNGDYPYNHVTAVDGTISAGGGMEYPNITVIGNASNKEELEVVIVHEVGHNWFYGLLGSNERDHAWMDEGLNTLNEIRYMETKYPGNTRMSDMAGGIVGKVHFDQLGHQDMSDLTFGFTAGYGLDQPINISSADYTSMNYGSIVYAKTGLIFLYLKDYLGEEVFDKAMQVYFDEWHYKHPQPADIQKVLERETGKDLSWLFHDLIETTAQIDYKIQKVKIKEGETVVTVRNTGQIDAPVRVDALSFGNLRDSKWIEPGNRKSTVTFKGESYDQFILDKERQMPESNRNNNYWSRKGLFHRTEPFKMQLGTGYNHGDQWNNYWLPAIGMNVYDKFMIGAVFHNQSIPKNKFEYTLVPLFSVGRTNIAGFADINYSWIPAKNIRMITLGATAKSFGSGLGTISENKDDLTTYYTIQPYLNFEIGKPAVKKYYKQSLRLQGHYILEQGRLFENTMMGGTMDYRFKYKKRTHTLKAGVRLDYYNSQNNDPYFPGLSYSSEALNLGIEMQYEFEYWDKKNKSVSLRVFLGQNLLTNGASNRYAFALGGQTGLQDVTYDQYLFGRNRTEGLWANQRIENQGGFKTTSLYGLTNGSLFATNFYVELPYIPFVGFYADYGLFDNAGTMEAVMDAGLGFKISDRLGVYFPLYESSNLKNSYLPGTTYANKIRFTLNLQGLTLGKIIPSVL